MLKRLHLTATLVVGWFARLLSPLLGDRGLPRQAAETSAAAAAAEPGRVIVHRGPAGEVIRRTSAVGEPPHHHTFEAARSQDLPDPFVLELRSGTVVGPYGATITPAGRFDFETSRYFSVYAWREHPLFLRAWLPRAHEVDGTIVSLATRGGDRNYYHFVLEVLPRWALVRSVLGDIDIDAVYVPNDRRYERELLALTGIDSHRLIPTGSTSAVRAERLLVPSYPNMAEMQPSWLVDWVRQALPARDVADKPRRLFVTRGGGPNTRRLVEGPAIEAMLMELGFTTIDPGMMSVRDQIDHFAAADVIVGIHGAGLTNLAFTSPGVRVLELFAPTYVKHCYWALTQNIPDAAYRYLIGDGRGPRPGAPMQGLQDDIVLSPEQVARALEQLLAV